MQHRWLIVGIVFVISGVLELGFFALTVLGVFTGAALGAIGVSEGEAETMALGGMLFVIYGVWFFCTLIPAILHMGTGGMLLMGKRPRKLTWAATVAGFLPMFTVYCMPTALISGIFGILALVLPEPEEEAA